MCRMVLGTNCRAGTCRAGVACAVWLVLVGAQSLWAQPRDGGPRDGGPREPGRGDVRGVVKETNASAGTVTLQLLGPRSPGEERVLRLSPQTEIVTNGPRSRWGIYQEAKLADLSAGALVTAALSADPSVVESLIAEGRTVRGQLKSVDVAKNSVTVQVPGRERTPEERTLPLAISAEITIDDFRGGRPMPRDVKLSDLVPETLVNLRLSLDDKQVVGISAEGPTVFGTVQAIDAAKNSLTVLARPPRGDSPSTERVVSVAPDAVVIVDDGRGRRLSLKEAKLAEIPLGSTVSVRLATDQAAVMVRAEGPQVSGQLRSVDVAGKTVKLNVFRNRGEAPEEKSYAVTDDARILIDNAAGRLGDVKVGDNTFAQVRLSLDQKSVQWLMVRQVPGR